MSEAIVELRQVSKSYEADGGRNVLDGVNLHLPPGRRISVIGPSGSGKSTLLNLLGTLDRPSSGTVRISGRETTDLDEAGLARLRAETIGFIFQLHHLLPQCTALENVLTPVLALDGVDWPAAEERASSLLRRVGLQDHARKVPGQLSGGERQRVAVVRALINRPKLLLADEPTGALDEANARNLMDLLLEISAAEGVTLVMVTHDRDLAARLDEVHELRGGHLHRR